jgi:hypothetical protein
VGVLSGGPGLHDLELRGFHFSPAWAASLSPYALTLGSLAEVALTLWLLVAAAEKLAEN